MQIKKIVLEWDGTEIPIPYEDARQLYFALKDIFENKTTYIPPTIPYTPPLNPYVTYCTSGEAKIQLQRKA